jgi:hypothetical protein
LKELKTQIDLSRKDEAEKVKNEGKRIVIEDTDGSDDEESNIKPNKNQEKREEKKIANESKETSKRQIKVTEVESDNDEDEEDDNSEHKQLHDEAQNKRVEKTIGDSIKKNEIETVNKETSAIITPVRKAYELPEKLTQVKDLANQAFTRGQYDDAMRHYAQIISELEANGN